VSCSSASVPNTRPERDSPCTARAYGSSISFGHGGWGGGGGGGGGGVCSVSRARDPHDLAPLGLIRNSAPVRSAAGNRCSSVLVVLGQPDPRFRSRARVVGGVIPTLLSLLLAVVSWAIWSGASWAALDSPPSLGFALVTIRNEWDLRHLARASNQASVR